MKRVLILRTAGNKPVSQNQDWQGLKDGVAESLDSTADVAIAALTDLVYDVNKSDTSITHSVEKWDIAEFDLVIFRRVGDDLELAIAAAHYLAMRKVQFIDQYVLTQGKGKLSGAFLRQSHNIPVPRTIYAAPHVLLGLIAGGQLFEFPFVLKADIGSKGRDNFLVRSAQQLQDVLAASKTALIAQPFIPNDGDYRVLVLNGKPSLAIHRKGSEGSHLNNTSQGGTAALVQPSELPGESLVDAIRAADYERLTVAGVDILIDKQSGNHYILEVNRAPQLSTGAFTKEKLAAYATMLEELLDTPKH